MGKQNNNIILIAGPTASGKSQLALEMAYRQDSVIINADSMQVYADLQILTARPSQDDMVRLPHHLYGFVDGKDAFSVGLWLDGVRNLLASPAVRQRKLIFVGGTGLYFRALGGGLAIMPEVPNAIRLYWRQRLEHEGAKKLYAELSHRDPLMAQRLKPGDGQRIIRALEMLDATGKSLIFWQTQKSPPVINMANTRKILLLPEREMLYKRINARFADMMQQGALGEVEKLMQRQLDGQLPVMKAIGVRELGAVLRGAMAQEQALILAAQETRRYAKRQISWFRNQLGDDNWQIFSDFPAPEKIFYNF